jgi:chitinase
MFSASCFALTTALLSLIASTFAGYSATSKDNVAIYYGQGPNESNLGLHDFCQNSNVDIIPLGFLDIYPAQGNGWPGTNFASSCESTNFAAPGYNNVNDPSKNDLKNNCTSLVDGIAFCQAQQKQILLSLGGAPGSTHYQLTSTADAEYMADFLWGAFGPLQNPNNWPRPFDTPTASNSVDGYDFDIEVIQPGEQQLYITMINRLIGYFPTGKGAKKYLITGAPQCMVPDSQMGDMITAVPFDILFVQYYNTDTCSARNWKTANPQYPSVPENPSGFSYEFDQLLTFLDMGASKNAKIFFGLPGADAAANTNEYLNPTDVTPFLEAYYCQPRFGGVMLWEGIYAYNNNMFQNTMKDLLVADSNNAALKTCPTTPPPCCTNPYTVVSGDYCYKIATANHLTLEAFYALNPSLGLNGVNCNYLQSGQTLCLARASSTTAVCSIASATKTTTTTSGTPTPTPCVTCTEYYTVQYGDY